MKVYVAKSLSVCVFLCVVDWVCLYVSVCVSLFCVYGFCVCVW